MAPIMRILRQQVQRTKARRGAAVRLEKDLRAICKILQERGTYVCHGD